MSGFTTLGKKNSGAFGGGGTSNANSTGPFGTTLVSDMYPVAQGTFVYGVNDTIWITGSNGSGAAVTSANGIVSCSSGNSSYASSNVYLNRACKYRAGQGTMARFTAAFSDGATDTLQLAGVGNGECGYYFAKSGTNFGILHRERSSREIRVFTLTSGVGVATLTVTLGGATKSITISGGNDANQTAYLISKQDYSSTGVGYTAEAYSNKVYFISNVPGPLSGTFSIYNGASSIATVATSQSGVLPIDTFISQSSWNIDTADGAGASRFLLDPKKGNVFGIGYQYLGFGNPVFSVENPETGLLSQCHMIHRAGGFNTTVLKNPTMAVGWSAINSGSAASSVSVMGASAGLFVEGKVLRNIGPAFAASATKTSVSSTEVPILSIRANRVYKDSCSYGELAPFNISLGNDTGNSSSGKLLRVQVYKNVGLTGPVNFQNFDAARSIAAIDTAATGIAITSSSQLLKTIIVAANSSVLLKLEDENFFLANGDVITLTGQRVGNSDIDTAAASISWFEDQ